MSKPDWNDLSQLARHVMKDIGNSGWTSALKEQRSAAVDKDQVEDISYKTACETIRKQAAELESLRAMRKRVEGLADELQPMLPGAANKIRTALGDSHE